MGHSEDVLTRNLGTEGLKDLYPSFIEGAKRILNTMTSVWKLSLVALIGSLSVIGLIAIAMYFLIPARELLFVEGVIFLALAAWILVRSLTGTCCACCTVEIPRWKRLLSSFIKPDGTIDIQREGEGIVDTVMQVILASEDWIRVIRRELLSILIWPILAALVFSLSIYTMEALTVKIVVLAFIAYVFALPAIIYYAVKIEFHGWELKVARFRANTDAAFQAI